MVDKVRPLKMESSSTGGTENDESYTELNPAEDYVAVKGVAFESSDDRKIDLDTSGNVRVKDATHNDKTLREISRGSISAGEGISYDPSTGVISAMDGGSLSEVDGGNLGVDDTYTNEIDGGAL